MKTRGERGQATRVLACAAAQILLKINAIRYDAVSDQPFRLDLSELSAHPQGLARLIEIMADVLYALDPNDVVAAGPSDLDLAQRIATRLHLPKTESDESKPLPLSWCARNLGTEGGFAVFDDRWTGPDQTDPIPVLCLTTWQDVLDVLHVDQNRQQASLRFALASHIKTRRAAIG